MAERLPYRVTNYLGEQVLVGALSTQDAVKQARIVAGERWRTDSTAVLAVDPLEYVTGVDAEGEDSKEPRASFVGGALGSVSQAAIVSALGYKADGSLGKAPLPQTYVGGRRVLVDWLSRESFVARLGDAGFTAWLLENYDSVQFARYYDTGPIVEMRFNIVSADPNASPTTTGDPSSISLGGGKWLAQQFGPEIRPEQLGARRDDSTDDRASVQHALRLSCHLGGTATLSRGTYRIVGPNTGAAALDLPTIGGFEGSRLVGAGRRVSKLAFVPFNQYQVLLQVSGGSGQIGNRVLQGFEAYSTVAGSGKLIEVTGTCGLPLRDLQLRDAGLGVELNNSGGSQFCEFVRFEGVFVYNMAHAGVQLWRGDGTNSYHGVCFPYLFLHLNGAGPGLKLGGTRFSAGGEASATVFWYNGWGEVAVMWDGTFTKKIIEAGGNVNAPSLELNMRVEGTGAGSVGQVDVASGGVVISSGRIDGITNITFPGAGIADFQRGVTNARNELSVKGTAPNILGGGASLLPFGSLANHDKATEGGAPAGGGLKAGNLGAPVWASFDPAASAANGHYFGYVQSGDGMKNVRAGAFIRGDGALIEGAATSVALRRRGDSTGLSVANGRVGGQIGRATTFPITANAGVAQTIDLIVVPGERYPSLIEVRLFGNQVDMRKLGFARKNGYGNAGYWTNINDLQVNNNTAGAVTAIGSIVLGVKGNPSDGRFYITITTDRDLTIQISEIGIGEMATVLT